MFSRCSGCCSGCCFRVLFRVLFRMLFKVLFRVFRLMTFGKDQKGDQGGGPKMANISGGVKPGHL